MKRYHKVNKLAKRLVELSKDNGVLTESKVSEVLSGLQHVQHRHHLMVLKTFLNYLRREVALQTAVVSTPARLSDDALRAIERQFSKLYNRPVNAVIQQDTSLIAGVRIRIGDDVYDSSVAGRLQRLAESVN